MKLAQLRPPASSRALELLGEPEILVRYSCGQYDRKPYRALIEEWLERKARERDARRGFERLLREVAESTEAPSATLAPRELVLATIDEVMAGLERGQPQHPLR